MENEEIEKHIEGAMNYRIELTTDNSDKIKVGVRFEQSNENNLIAFSAVKMLYTEMFDAQKQPGDPKSKLSKSEIKDLQIAINLIGKHIESLNNFVYEKYKNAVFTKDKPKIDLITNADILNNPKLKIIK
jgi:hypothetical protein